MTYRSQIVGLQLVVAIAIGIWTQPLEAQLNPGSVSVFPPAPRSMRQNLVRAKKAIEEGRFSDAVAEIGVVLTVQNQDVGAADENQDFFIEAAGQPGVQTSIKAEAQRMLGNMPPKGRELFELQFGADARALFDKAIQQGDVNQLNEVLRQYFHTKAGYEAALLLGRLHLDHGRPLAAALCLQRVAQVPSAAAQFEPELSLLLAACWQLAHQPTQAQATLATLPARLPRGQIRLGDAEINELPTAQQAVAWLTEHFRALSMDENEAGEWPLFRGNPSRNAVRSGGIPLKRARWQVPLVRDDRDRTLVDDLRTGFIEQGSPMMPVVQPLAVGNTILLRSSERLIGIDFDSGKRVFFYPPWDDLLRDESQETNTSLPLQNNRESQLGTLRERLWEDVPFGQVSSDGNSVYLLDGMQQILPQMNPRRPGWPRGRFGFPEPASLQNELVALDLQREGYIQWTAGGDTGAVEPKLAGVFFLGPPLPLFGNLYLVAELKGELRLVVLDAATGKQQWSQQLAHMEAMLGVDERTRRYSGATPSFADGVLVCPTSAGAVVAVDVATRTLLWGYQYGSNNRDIFGRPGFMQQPLPFQTAVSVNRWQDSAVTIADGSVVISAVESDSLVCLDLLTGKPRWAPLPRSGELADMLYVAGVYDGAAILVGKNRMTAIRLKDGQPAWKESVKLQQSDNEMPSGRGFLSEHYYYLPTTKPQLVKVDLRNGEIVERASTDHPLGNVICYRDEIISVAADRASTFFQIEPLRKKVDARLAKSPGDAWALARHGELLVHDGKSVEALAVLRTAHQLDNRDEAVRSLLVDTFLTALEEDFDKHSGLAAEIEPLVDTDAQRARYLMLVATGHERAGNRKLALENYVKLALLAATNAKKLPPGESFPQVSPDKNWSVRSDRYLATRLAEHYATNDSSLREPIDALVQELSARTDPAIVADVRRFLQLCGFHPATNELRLSLASRLIESGNFLEAEVNLEPLLNGNDRGFTGRALALSAKLYDLAKKPNLSAQAYQTLLRDWADTVVLNNKTGRQLHDEAAPKRVSSGVDPLEWPWGMVESSESHDVSRNPVYSMQQPCYSILQRRGAALENLKLVFDGARGSTYLRDGNGNIVVKIPPGESRIRTETGLWQTAADGHLLFICFDGHLMAVNTISARPNELESVLWRDNVLAADKESIQVITKESRNPFDPNATPISQFADPLKRPLAMLGPMTSRGVCFQKIRAIVCLDSWTGTPVWTRNDFEQGCEIFGDHEYVFVRQQTGANQDQESANVECSMLSAVDGRTLGKRQVPAPANRWTICGRNILAWEQKKDTPGQIRLFLRDAEQQKDIWSESFDAKSKGCLIDNDAVAILQPDGRFVVRSLTGAAPVTESKIDPIAQIASIRAIASSDQILLVVNDGETTGENDGWRRKNFIPADGRIYSIDRATGENLWPIPAVVRGFGMLLEQPVELPTLWFVRYQSGNNNQIGTTGNPRVEVLCLDRRTGARLFEKKNIPTNLNSSEVIVEPRKSEVTLSLQQAQFTLRFTSDPRPPAPPYQQMPEKSSLDSKGGGLGGFIRDVFTPPNKDDPFK